jgi:hypothetical protein
MRTVLRTVFAILILMMGAATLPATAASAPAAQPAVLTTDTSSARFTPVAFNTDIRHISLAEAAAIIGGAVVVGTAADMAFSGGVFTALGAVAGAVLGSEWYERGMWPFNRSVLGTGI